MYIYTNSAYTYVRLYVSILKLISMNNYNIYIYIYNIYIILIVYNDVIHYISIACTHLILYNLWGRKLNCRFKY